MPKDRYQALAFAIAFIVVAQALLIVFRMVTGAGQ
jgi:hypothetical protein